MPERDELAPNSTQEESDELIYLSEYSKDNILHLPLVSNTGFQAFFDLQTSEFTSSGVMIGREEFRAWRSHLQRSSRQPSSRRDPHSLPQADILRALIQGNDVQTPEEADFWMERYFLFPVCPATMRASFCQHFVDLMHLPNRPPLVVDTYNWHLGRFALWCLYYQSHALQTATRKFVLVGSQGDHPTSLGFFFPDITAVQQTVNISYLLNHPLLAHLYSVNGNVRHPKFTPLPIGFLFYHRNSRGLSPTRPDQMLQDEILHNQHMKLYLKGLDLHKVFPHIQHELRFGRVGAVWLETALEMFAGGTTDATVEWIPLEQLPKRVTTIYVVLMPLEREKREGRPSLTSEVLVFRSESGNRATAAAQHVALLPFTAALYHKLQQHPYGDPSRELKVIKAYTMWNWRTEIDSYLKSHPELIFEPEENVQRTLFSYLNNFTFVASPIGVGYECYRAWEALAFGAIPILQHPSIFERQFDLVGSVRALEYGREINVRGLVDLYKDLPVVFIYDASEITRKNMEHWRQIIKEKFLRGEYHMEKLFMQYWVDVIHRHTNEERSDATQSEPPTKKVI